MITYQQNRNKKKKTYFRRKEPTREIRGKEKNTRRERNEGETNQTETGLMSENVCFTRLTATTAVPTVGITPEQGGGEANLTW